MSVTRGAPLARAAEDEVADVEEAGVAREVMAALSLSMKKTRHPPGMTWQRIRQQFGSGTKSE
jgi:hypothetical protein